MINLTDEQITILLDNMSANDVSMVRNIATHLVAENIEFTDSSTGEKFAPETVQRIWSEARRRSYHCYACQKSKLSWEWTRDSSGIDLCAACYDEAGLENEHQDGYHAEKPVSDCPMCEAEASAT
jgi:hypothetical protein